MSSTRQTQTDLSRSDVFNGRYNILKVIYDNQIGLSKTQTFKSDVRNVKVEQLVRSPASYRIEDGCNMLCKSLKASNQGIIGVWKCKMSQDFHHSMIHLKFLYNPAKGNEMIEPIFLPVQDGPFKVNLNVTDFLSTGKKYCFLYVIGNTREKGHLLCIPESEASCEEETDMEFSHFVYSVAFHYKRPIVAVGSENRCYMYDSRYESTDVIELPNLPGNVYSLAFDKRGNSLFCGCDRGQMASFDLRMNLKSGAEKPFTRLGVENVVDMKLLWNENLMVFSNIVGQMGLMDLRKRDVVFYFPEHKNTLISRKLTVCNELDLICATGDDNISRLWSVNTGTLLKRIVPPRKDVVTHSCLLTSNRQWYAVEVQNNFLTPVLLKQ